MSKFSLSLGKQVLLGALLISAVSVFSLIFLVERGETPYAQAYQEAETLAMSYAGIQKVTDFSIFNAEESYYSLLGKDQEGQDLAMLVPTENEGTIQIYNLANGISSQEAQAIARREVSKPVLKVTFGYQAGQALWEVAMQDATYFLIDFETGAIIRRMG